MNQQPQYLLEKNLKKELRRRIVILAIPAICFVIALLGNWFEYLEIEAEIQNASDAQAAAVSNIEKTMQEDAEADDKIIELEAQLSSYQEELAALPTPAPTPAVTPVPDSVSDGSDYDSSVTFEQLKRYPADYIGKKIAVFGKVTSEDSGRGTKRSRSFRMYMNGEIGQRVDVLYSDEDGRVMSGDVVSVYGTIEEDPLWKGEIVLVADSIYFPTEEEINEWAQNQVDAMIDEVFGDNPNADQLKSGLDSWQKGLDEINGR